MDTSIGAVVGVSTAASGCCSGSSDVICKEIRPGGVGASASGGAVVWVVASGPGVVTAGAPPVGSSLQFSCAAHAFVNT